VGCPGPPEQLHESKSGADWFPIPEELYQGGPHGDILARLRYFAAPAGSLRLWRSDMIHANTLGHHAFMSQLKPEAVSRAASYVCWAPKVLTNAEECRQKIATARDGRSHNHWPTIYTNGGKGGNMSDDGTWIKQMKTTILPEQIRAMGGEPQPLFWDVVKARGKESHTINGGGDEGGA
jgi:hypothetical protein